MIIDLAYNQQCMSKSLEEGQTDSNPICECMMMAAQRMASMVGLRVPAAKGAMVSGKIATEMILYIARSVKGGFRVFGQDQSVSHTFRTPNGSCRVLAQAWGSGRGRWLFKHEIVSSLSDEVVGFLLTCSIDNLCEMSQLNFRQSVVRGEDAHGALGGV